MFHLRFFKKIQNTTLNEGKDTEVFNKVVNPPLDIDINLIDFNDTLDNLDR